MQETLAQLNEELEASWGVTLAIRIGINTGEVVTGNDASAQTLATGDAVNAAKRIQQAAEPGDILLGRETYRLVRDRVRAGPLESFSLKGKRQPVSPWRLLGTGKELAPRLEAPLIGRERELALLRERFERAVSERRCRLVTVLGGAGVGKSRLVRELGQQLLGASISKGRCLPYGEGITFWPVRDIVRQVARIGSDDSPDEARRKIGQLVPAGEEAEAVCRTVAGALALGDEAAPAEQIFWAIRLLFEALAARRPVVLVFEDIHWAEPTLLDLLEYLEGWSRGAPILLLCLARPELLELRPSWASTETVTVEPLGERETHELVFNLVGGGRLERLARAIWDAAEGNPLFVEEMLRMLIDDGVLVRRDGGWALGELAPGAIPGTITALLAARLDRLESNERVVIQLASVLGRQFAWAGVTELAPEELKPRVGSSLQALVRKKMILPDETTIFGEDAFRFAHILMRDAAYASLPKSERARLHERFADWLERRSGARAVEYEEILGYHLEQAYRARVELEPVDERGRATKRRGGALLGSAGRRALAREDIPAAIALLERAAALLADDPDAVSRVLVDLGAALRESGDLARADAVLVDAAEAAVTSGHAHLHSRALVERSSLRAYVDPEVEAGDLLRTAARAIRVCDTAGDELGLAKAWIHVAEVRWMQCRCAEMEEVLERALVHAERSGGRRELSLILGSLTRASLLGPRPVDDAIRRCLDARERGRGNLVVDSYANSVLAVLNAMRGHFEDARDLYARTTLRLEEVGLNVLLASLQMYAGMVELIAGDDAAAERALRLGYDRLEQMGERSYLSTTAAYLSRPLYKLARYEEALELTRLSEAAASADDLASHILWRCTRAKVLARRGEAEAAQRLGADAVALAGKTDLINTHADALVDLAEVLLVLEQPAEAASALDEALELYEAKGNIVSAGGIRLLVKELIAGSAA
jgi:predicted ATPase